MPPFTSLCLNQSPFACGSVGAIAQTGLVIWVQAGTWCTQAARVAIWASIRSMRFLVNNNKQNAVVVVVYVVNIRGSGRRLNKEDWT